MNRVLSRLIVGGLFCILSFQIGFSVLAVTSPSQTPDSEVGKPLPFLQNVAIPGLNLATEFKVVTRNGVQYIQVPYLAQYITAIVKYASGIGLIVAAVMVVYGGFLYILGSTFQQISRGKEVISDALIGLVLLLGSYTFLAAVSPSLETIYKPLEVQTIPKELENLYVMPVSDWQKLIAQPGKPTGTPNLADTPNTKDTQPASDVVAAPPPEAGGAPPPEAAPEGAAATGPDLSYNPSDCKFTMNLAGIPTMDSLMDCLKIVSKKFRMSPCFGVTAIIWETGGTALANTIGHDEAQFALYSASFLTTTPINRDLMYTWVGGGRNYLESGKMYKPDKNGVQTFSACGRSCGKGECATAEQLLASLQNYRSCNAKAPKNDDQLDPNAPDFGIDWRFTHGFGQGQVTFGGKDFCKPGVPSTKVAGLCLTLQQLLTPYGGLWSSLVILKHGGAGLPGNPSRAWACYAGNNCQPQGQSIIRTNYTLGCIASNPDNPIMSLKADGLDICRGDYGLDRELCEQMNDERRAWNKEHKSRNEQKPLIRCTSACIKFGAQTYGDVQKAYAALGISGEACDPRSAKDRSQHVKDCPLLEYTKL